MNNIDILSINNRQFGLDIIDMSILNRTEIFYLVSFFLMMILLIFTILSNISLFEIHQYDLIPNEDLDETVHETVDETGNETIDETVDETVDETDNKDLHKIEVDYENINFNQTDDYF